MTLLTTHLWSTLARPDFYLDPGSGSMLLQLLLAALLGMGVILRTQWSKIKSLFKPKDSSDEEDEDLYDEE
jgi:hypothetical protein